MKDPKTKKKCKVTAEVPYLDQPEVRAQLDAITKDLEAKGLNCAPYAWPDTPGVVLSFTDYLARKNGGRNDG